MKRAIALVVALATALTACGGDAAEPATSSSNSTRSIDVMMVDTAFTPLSIDVAAGETVTFTFRNEGSVRHEALFGDLAVQEAHHAEMAELDGDHDMGDMDSMDTEVMGTGSMDHDAETMTESHVVILEPGQTIEVSHTFGAAGQMMLGCHEPGHWEAGMKANITVA